MPNAFATRVRSEFDKGFFVDLPKFGLRRVEVLVFEEIDHDTGEVSIEFRLDPPISVGPPTPEPVFLFTFTSDLPIEENLSELRDLVLANPAGVTDLPIQKPKRAQSAV